MSTSFFIFVSVYLKGIAHNTLNIRTFFITTQTIQFSWKRGKFKRNVEKTGSLTSFTQSGFLPWSALDEPNSQTMSHKRRKSRAFFIPQFPCAGNQLVVTMCMCMCILTLARVQTLFMVSFGGLLALPRLLARNHLFPVAFRFGRKFFVASRSKYFL